MRGEDQAELLEVRHHVAHRSRRQRDRQQARQIARAERLAGGEIALDDVAENLARALVERRQAYSVRADRDVVGSHGLTPYNRPRMAIAADLFKPDIWLWCAPTSNEDQARCGRAADKSTNCAPSRSNAAWSNTLRAPVS